MRRIIATLLTGAAFAFPAMAGAGGSGGGGGVEWKPWTGTVPRNAIRGGVDQYGTVPLYICRARHINGVHPGKLLDGKCNIGWGGDEIVLKRFEVLVSSDRHYRDHSRRR